MVGEELKKQLPPRLLIPNDCIRLFGAVGQGKYGAHNVWKMRILHTLRYLGEFGEVYKAHLIEWHDMGMNQIVAVKTLKGTESCSKSAYIYLSSHYYSTFICAGLFTPNDVQQMVKEVVQIQDFEHPHVMTLLGVCLDSGVGIVMPYMVNGSVLSYLKREKAALFLSEEAELEEVRYV